MQSGRIADRLIALESQLRAKQAWFQANAISTSPNTVLVIELATSLSNFAKAAARLGIEILGEWDAADEIDATERGFNVFKNKDTLKTEQRTNPHVYLSSFGLTALEEVKRLFEKWKKNDPWPSDGTTPWRDLFNCILEIRPWGARDRLQDSGLIDDWRASIDAGETSVEFEADFWFRPQNTTSRQASEQQLARLLSNVGGSVTHNLIIEPIGYHGLRGRIPISAIRDLNAVESLDFVQYDEIFELHPVMQAVSPLPGTIPFLIAPSTQTRAFDSGPPIVGLIDGVPLQNHPDIADGVVVEDVDGLEAQSQSQSRVHGTAMASLILNGDLSVTAPRLSRRVTVRPVLVPYPSLNGSIEHFPKGRLALDTFHRAVLDLVATPEGTPLLDHPVLINVSLGDPNRAFLRRMSPWARLLDWLAYKYRVLFVVSAGNHARPILIEAASGSARSMNPRDRQSAVLDALYDDRRNRTLLAPAESINALTVGSANSDLSGSSPSAQLMDVMADEFLLSPTSAIGGGFRNTIKPDVLAPGGRQLFREGVAPQTTASALLEVATGMHPPGVLVAAPYSPIEAPKRWYLRGTSVAAALTTRLGAQIVEELDRLPAANRVRFSANLSVVIKALLAHSAGWGEQAQASLEQVLTENGIPNAKLKDYIARFLGHGMIRAERAFRCTDQRVTVIGEGELKHGEAHVYRFPWPKSLRARVDERRLTITLASLVPIVAGKYAYRGADVWVAKPNECSILGLESGDRDQHAIQRGTLQHISYAGARAADFAESADVTLQVNCRADATDELSLPPVPYALIVSLEVAEGSPLQIYEEVEIGLRTQIRVPTR
jgi:hypothetical protein